MRRVIRRVVGVIGAGVLAGAVAAPAAAIRPMDSGVVKGGVGTYVLDSEDGSGGGSSSGDSSRSGQGGSDSDPGAGSDNSAEPGVPASLVGRGAQHGPETSSAGSDSGGSSGDSMTPAERAAARERARELGTWCDAEERDLRASLPSICERPDPTSPGPVPASAPESGGSGEPEVSVEQVVQTARDELRLSRPSVNISPCLANPGQCRGTVGVPVWLAVEDGGSLPSETAEASAGDYSVQATAKVTKVKWSLGDGQKSTVCQGAGTVYDADVHGWSSPDCGFDVGWTTAGDYTVTASYV